VRCCEFTSARAGVPAIVEFSHEHFSRREP